jgi:RND family efflux transporter MFP subunit
MVSRAEFQPSRFATKRLGEKEDRVKKRVLQSLLSGVVLLALAASGCKGPVNKSGGAKGAGMQGLPVQTAVVTLAPVPQSSEYVATIKSRRSATLQAQVAGLLTAIRVRSGDRVKAGAVLMEIDPRQQMATVQSLRATERQKKALFDFDSIEHERQRKLFEAGVSSRDAFDQAHQAYENAKADYESAVEARKTQEELLSFYTVRAPFDGVVGDIPVHVGDYVTPALAPNGVLTTVDENKDLEAYIYVPTERSSQLRAGLEVQLTDNSGKLLEKTRIDFLSSQVDSTMQGILIKAPVHSTLETLRTAQMIKARVIWSSAPMAVVPVLAVTRQGGQSFVFIAQQQNGMTMAMQTPVTLGDTVGNTYSVSAGLKPGDRVIVSGTQFLVNGMPVIPMGG